MPLKLEQEQELIDLVTSKSFMDKDKSDPDNVVIRPLTFRLACLAALGDVGDSASANSRCSATETADRFKLMMKLNQAEAQVELDIGEINTLRAVLPKRWPPKISGQVLVIIDEALGGKEK